MDRPVDIKIPRSSEPTLLGVFICKDTKKEGRCAGKKVVDINMVYKEHSPDRNRSHSWRPDDKIYFFQPLIVQEDQVWSLSWPDIGQNGENLDAGIKYVVKNQGISPELVNRAIVLDQTIKSEIFKGSCSNYQISLPHYSKKKCAGKK